MFKYLQEKTSLPTAPWSEIRSFGPTIIFFLPQNAQKLRLRLDVAMHDSDLVKETHLRKPQLQRASDQNLHNLHST